MIQRNKMNLEVTDEQAAIPHLIYKDSVMFAQVDMLQALSTLQEFEARYDSIDKVKLIKFQIKVKYLFGLVRQMAKAKKLDKKNLLEWNNLERLFRNRNISYKYSVDACIFLTEITHDLNITNLLLPGGRDYMAEQKSEYS